MFSSTKSITAIVFASLVDRGLLTYDDRVVDHWPEFDSAGGDVKRDMKICDVLRHEAGLVYLDETIMFGDMLTENIKANSIGAVLERQTPNFPPSKYATVREYHGLTRGWILNEIFRRVDPDQRTIGEYLREEIAPRLKVDLYIGAKEPELARVVDLQRWKVGKVARESVRPSLLGGRIDPTPIDMYKLMRRMRRKKKESSVKRPPATEDMDKIKANDFIPTFNKEIIRRGEVPSGNGCCSARGMAKLGACIVNAGEWNGVSILGPKTVEALHDKPLKRVDYNSDMINEFTQGGVNYYCGYDDDKSRDRREKCGREGFHGWMGFGGSVFQWHRELGISFAYAPTLVCWYDLQNVRGGKLQEAVVECVLEKRAKVIQSFEDDS